MTETTIPKPGVPSRAAHSASAPTSSNQAPTTAPRTIGKYEIRRELGRGACGVVYQAFDPFVRRDVALKVALQSVDHTAPVVSSTDSAALDTQAQRQGFFDEAHTAGILQHPNIVSVFDAGRHDGNSFIVMEYVEGETLRHYSRPNCPKLTVADVVDVLLKSARALHYAHTKGVLHRDIKPGNIMLRHDGVTKIVDFSVAEIMRGDSGGARKLVGSPLYLAPEQIRGSEPSPQTDLYALGMVGFELLAQNTAFVIKDLKSLFTDILSQPPPSLSSIRNDLPSELVAIIQQLLAKKPAQRHESGQALALQLLNVQESLRSNRSTSGRDSRDALRKLSFFDEFSDDEIDELMSVSQMVTMQTGQTIIKEGEIDDSLFIIVRGSVEVRRGDVGIQTLMQGDCFGEAGFLTKYKRMASVVASSPVLLLKVSGSLLQKVSMECQLRYFRVITSILVYRLNVTSAHLTAIKRNG